MVYDAWSRLRYVYDSYFCLDKLYKLLQHVALLGILFQFVHVLGPLNLLGYKVKDTCQIHNFILKF